MNSQKNNPKVMDKSGQIKPKGKPFSGARWSSEGLIDGVDISESIPKSERIETYESPELDDMLSDDE